MIERESGFVSRHSEKPNAVKFLNVIDAQHSKGMI
jgi:hypothetical protein